MVRRITASLILLALFSSATVIPQARALEPLSWHALIEKLQKRIERNTYRDVSISFQNAPYANFLEDELVAYTIRADGTVIIQMHDQVKVLKVSPSELLWLCKFLLAHGLADLPENETAVSDSGSYALIVRVGASRKGIWLYNKNNDVKRQVLWQYLLRLGQEMLAHTGLRPKTMAVLPVCMGINGCDELDTNSDGLVEWLRLRIGFYCFNPGEYAVDFAGIRRTIFLPQGTSEKEFPVNTYLLRNDKKSLGEYLVLSLNSVPAYPTGPFRMALGFEDNRYHKETFCARPDLTFKGEGKWRFPVGREQAVIVDITRSVSQNMLARFCVNEILNDSVKIVGKEGMLELVRQEMSPVGVWGCVSTMFGLADIEAGKAVFEIGWDVPQAETIERRIVNFREFAASDQYNGDIESIKSQLEAAEACKEDLQQVDKLQIDVVYCCPSG